MFFYAIFAIIFASRISIVMVGVSDTGLQKPSSPSLEKTLSPVKTPLYIHISLIIVTRSLWFSLLLRHLAYVSSAYVSDISRLVSVYVSQQQRYSAPLEYYLTFQGPLDSVLSCVRPLSSSLSLFGDILEFRGTYEVKKINLATKKSMSEKQGEEHVEDDWS